MFKVTMVEFGGQIGCHMTERQDEAFFDSLSGAESFIVVDKKNLLYMAATEGTVDYAVVYDDGCHVEYQSAGKEWSIEIRYSITEEEPE